MNYKKYFKKVSVIVLLFFLTSTSLIMSYNKGDENKIIKENSNENMEIAITFDDGPHPKETAKILDVLKKYDAKATFFVVGKHVKWYPDSVIRASKEGHEIGNHTYTHINVSKNGYNKIKKEIGDNPNNTYENFQEYTDIIGAKVYQVIVKKNGDSNNSELFVVSSDGSVLSGS